MLPQNIKLEESVICLNHYWLCENRHVNEKVMQSLVKDVRGTRTYGSAALEFAHVAEGIIGAYLTMRLEPWDIAAGKRSEERRVGKEWRTRSAREHRGGERSTDGGKSD